MNRDQFRKLFAEEAKTRGWIKVTGGWHIPIQENDANVVAIELQKSTYGDQFYVGLKVFRDSTNVAEGGRIDSLKSMRTNLYRRTPRELDQALDLTAMMENGQRRAQLKEAFDFITTFAAKAKTKDGLIELRNSGMLFVPSEIIDDC